MNEYLLQKGTSTPQNDRPPVGKERQRNTVCVCVCGEGGGGVLAPTFTQKGTPHTLAGSGGGLRVMKTHKRG